MSDAPNNSPLVIGVVADTHVPDRRERVDPRLLAVFEKAGVSIILHAGDISTAEVLSDLRRVAPVTAVMGNRDFSIRGLPLIQKMNLLGVPLVLTHGHGGLLGYIAGKIVYLTRGYSFERYWRPLKRQFPKAQVIVFGHTHRVVNEVIDGCLFFNPGAAYECLENGQRPHVGLLTIYPNRRVDSQVIDLDSA